MAPGEPTRVAAPADIAPPASPWKKKVLPSAGAPSSNSSAANDKFKPSEEVALAKRKAKPADAAAPATPQKKKGDDAPSFKLKSKLSIRKKIQNLLEEPKSSSAAMVVIFVMIAVILISVLNFSWRRCRTCKARARS